MYSNLVRREAPEYKFHVYSGPTKEVAGIKFKKGSKVGVCKASNRLFKITVDADARTYILTPQELEKLRLL